MELPEISPKAKKTRQACKIAISFMLESPLLIENMRRAKMLPIKIIEKNTRVPRKLIERHRKYIMTVVEILHDDYPYLREYFKDIRKGELT
jgi:RNA polymerase sigma factor